MKRRCLDQNDKDYPRYGGSGVTVDAAWAESFELFYAHIGARPRGTTLDRKDNSKGYEAGNVRWATAREQQSNRRDSWFVQIGDKIFQSQEEAAAAYGISATTIIRWCEGYTDSRRINSGFRPPRDNCRRWRKY
jgi:intein-encoded DNA endonuclease-like protein